MPNSKFAISNVDRRPQYLEIYNLMNKKEEMVEEKIKYGKNDFPIGFASPNFSINNMIVVNINAVEKEQGEVSRKSKVFGIVGRKGSGKSVMLGMIADYYKLRFNVPIFILDPFGEFYVKRSTFAYDKSDEYQNYVDDFLESINEKRIAYKNLLVICPLFMKGNSDANIDKFFTISFKNIKLIMKYDKMEAVSLLIDLLGITNNDSNADLIFSTIASRSINSWSELLIALKDESKATKGKASVIFSRIRTRLNANIISDDDTHYLNILEELSTRDMVVMKAQLRQTLDDDYITTIYNAYVKIIITTIRLDLQHQGEDNYLTNPQGIFLGIDEIDSVAPAVGTSSLRITITQLASKFRKAMINLGMATQSISKVDPTLFQQCNFVLTPKLEKDNSILISYFNISDEWINILSNLKKGVKTNLNTIVSEFAVINLDTPDLTKRIRIFYPSIPLSAIYSRG